MREQAKRKYGYARENITIEADNALVRAIDAYANKKATEAVIKKLESIYENRQLIVTDNGANSAFYIYANNIKSELRELRASIQEGE